MCSRITHLLNRAKENVEQPQSVRQNQYVRVHLFVYGHFMGHCLSCCLQQVDQANTLPVLFPTYYL